LSLAHGDREEELADCVRLFRLARLMDREPMLIGYLVALAIRGAACDETNRVLLDGPVSDQARQALDNELAAHERMDGLLHALKTERALGNTSFHDMIGDGLRSFVLWHLKNQQSNYLDRMAREIELGARPLHEIDDELAKLRSHTADGGALVSLIGAPLDAARQAVDRVRANIRCLRVFSALQSRSGHAGDDQIDLDDLALPETAKTDPFTGEPLIVHKSAKGWTVYSVGSNLKDDGGNLDPAHDVGAGVNLARDGVDH
jgi:hypothetical protein